MAGPTGNELVQKVRASGYMPKQVLHPKRPPVFKKKQGLSSVDTKKGKSRAFVARDGMPISIEPIKSPRSKTLAQIGRNIKNV